MIQDGQPVNAASSNAAWVSKTATSGNVVTGIVALQNGSSGGNITNVQQTINDKADLVDARFPSTNEKAALIGTEGSPGPGNAYVTSADARVAESVRFAGPALDNLVARFDGTSGQLIKDSVVSIDNSGNTDIPGTLHLHAAGSGSAITDVQATIHTKADTTDTRFPTADEKAALVGTNGTASTSNKYVTSSDPRVPTQDENDALVGTSGAPSTSNKYVTSADTRLPSQDENDALIGTNGTPSTSNKFVTNSDSRLPSTDEKAAMVGTNGTPSTSNKFVTDSDPRISSTVTGPGSSTDNAIVRFDGTGGTTLQNSVVTVSDTGAVTGATSMYVGGSSLHASAILQADSTTKGFLPPRVTTTERDAISSPATGLIVYNTTTGTAQYWNGSAWGNIASATVSAPTVQKFTSGSGTYTTPANVKWIRVRMVGGGGGGGGSGTDNGTAAGSGGNTTFGSSLLVANGGVLGGRFAGGGNGGAGGTASLGTGPIGVAITGATGGAGTTQSTTTVQAPGGYGASSPLGGAGGQVIGSGGSAVANTGSGGAGGSTGGAAGTVTGGGGGAGGYVDAIITSPSSTYSYAVGAGGTAGAAGSSGFGGGVGAAGIIIVEEHYT